jgi:hypothetical protein
MLLVALAALVGACATTSGGGRDPSGSITQEEIEASGLVFNNAYEVVRQFRPQWLIKRGTVNIDPGNNVGELIDYVVVYVDNILRGDPETLRSITAQSIREVEHFNRAEAQRLGPRGHPHGAIVVHTRAR